MKTRTSSSAPLLMGLVFVPICGLVSAFVYSLTRFSDILDGDFSLLEAIPIAVIGGVLFGGPIMLWVAINDRTITITENYDDHQSFLEYLTAMLIEEGYPIVSQEDQIYIFKQDSQIPYNISLELNKGTCTITGPRPTLSNIQSRLSQARITGDYTISSDDETLRSETTIEQPAAETTTSKTEPTIPVIPSNCLRCLAPLTLEKVSWTGPLSAACPYCGVGIDVEWRKIG